MKYRVKNKITGEVREAKVFLKALEKAADTGIDRCVGPCNCKVELDAECPKGWPSRMMAVGGII